MMGYQPASSGLFITVWISKLLKGARRNFPSRFAEREAHSAILFQKFRRNFAHWFFMREFFVPHGELASEGIAMIRTFLASITWFGFLAEVVLESVVVSLMRGSARRFRLSFSRRSSTVMTFVLFTRTVFFF